MYMYSLQLMRLSGFILCQLLVTANVIIGIKLDEWSNLRPQTKPKLEGVLL